VWSPRLPMRAALRVDPETFSVDLDEPIEGSRSLPESSISRTTRRWARSPPGVSSGSCSSEDTPRSRYKTPASMSRSKRPTRVSSAAFACARPSSPTATATCVACRTTWLGLVTIDLQEGQLPTARSAALGTSGPPRGEAWALAAVQTEVERLAGRVWSGGSFGCAIPWMPSAFRAVRQMAGAAPASRSSPIGTHALCFGSHAWRGPTLARLPTRRNGRSAPRQVAAQPGYQTFLGSSGART
jgi:hypothetical protein